MKRTNKLIESSSEEEKDEFDQEELEPDSEAEENVPVKNKKRNTFTDENKRWLKTKDQESEDEEPESEEEIEIAKKSAKMNEKRKKIEEESIAEFEEMKNQQEAEPLVTLPSHLEKKFKQDSKNISLYPLDLRQILFQLIWEKLIKEYKIRSEYYLILENSGKETNPGKSNLSFKITT
jgi:hypothetical protein